MGKELSSTVLL